MSLLEIIGGGMVILLGLWHLRPSDGAGMTQTNPPPTTKRPTGRPGKRA
jgi:hypothetical protein